MLWVVAPLAASATTALLLTGCAKGRDEPVRVKSSKSGGARRHSSAAGGHKSGRSSRSLKSGRAAGDNKSSRSSGRRPAVAGAPGASGKSSRSKRDVSKSGRSSRAAGAKGVQPRAGPVKPGDKSSRSKRSALQQRPAGAVAVKATGSKRSSRETRSGKSSSRRSKSTSSQRAKKQAKPAVLPVDKTQSLSKEVVMIPPGGRDCNAITSKKSHKSPAAVSVTKLELAPMEGVAKHEVRIEPSELRWKTSGGIQNVAVYNHSNTRKALKIKCSDNLLYRVNPVHTFVPAGGSVRIDILRQNGSAKVDKIVLIAADAAKEDNVARDVLNRSQNTDMMVLPLIAAN